MIISVICIWVEVGWRRCPLCHLGVWVRRLKLNQSLSKLYLSLWNSIVIPWWLFIPPDSRLRVSFHWQLELQNLAEYSSKDCTKAKPKFDQNSKRIKINIERRTFTFLMFNYIPSENTEVNSRTHEKTAGRRKIPFSPLLSKLNSVTLQILFILSYNLSDTSLIYASSFLFRLFCTRYLD